MLNSKYESVSPVSQENNFKISNNVSNEPTYIICEGRSINTSCRYCLNCITNYSNGEDKLCPGSSLSCKENVLNVDRNVSVDEMVHKDNFRDKGKCSEESCRVLDDNSKIEDNTRVFKKRETCCPYSKLGCSEIKLVNDEINGHLIMNNWSHSKLLMNWIENCQNELQYMKKKSDQQQILLKELCAKDFHQELEITELKKVIGEHRREIDKVRSEMRELKVETNINQLSVIELKRRDTLKGTQVEHLKQELHQNKDPVIFHGNTINKYLQRTFSDVIKLKNELSLLQKNFLMTNYGEFVWKIERFSEKHEQARTGINTEIHSDPFYSHRNGYKLCLCMYPNGGGVGEGTYLSLGFSLMKGDFDELLSWPMKHDVIFGIINRESGTVHKKAKSNYLSTLANNRYVFEKPDTERNTCISFPKFVNLTELFGNTCLVMRDTVIIKCSVNISK